MVSILSAFPESRPMRDSCDDVAITTNIVDIELTAEARGAKDRLHKATQTARTAKAQKADVDYKMIRSAVQKFLGTNGGKNSLTAAREMARKELRKKYRTQFGKLSKRKVLTATKNLRK